VSDTTYLGRKIRRFSSSPQFDGYSKVIIIVSDEIEYTAGNDLGRTMRLTCPWGTPEMAENILESIRGYQYQPYTAEDAILDPAVELGDGVTANNVYGGVYTQKIKFGPLLRATVSAPEEEEINHEYPYKSKPNKEITREAKMLRASLAIQADRITAEITDRQNDVATLTAQLQIQAGLIEAKVSKTGGSDDSSFGWVLTDSAWTITANKTDILKATKDGLEVYGKITATSGKIGGFDINSNYLSYNNQNWGGTLEQGIYIGQMGIQLGKSFKVDVNGNLQAFSGKFTGTVYAGSIKYGQTEGYFSGSGISSGTITGNRLVSRTVGTAYVSAGINTSLGYADFSNDVFNGTERATTVKASSLVIGEKNIQFVPKTIAFVDGLGNTRSWIVLAESG
jgi:hypothetical protein